MNTILVTGATGLIGSRLVQEILSLTDHRVIAMGRNEEKLQKIFASVLNNPNFTYKAQDATLPLESSIVEPVDIIFHAAGPIARDIIAKKPVDVIAPNIIGTLHCLEFLRKQACDIGKSGKLILFSSATVYGNIGAEDIEVTEEDTHLTDRLDDISAPYSQSKRMVEVLAKAYSRQYQVHTVCVRLSYVYGPTNFTPDTAIYEFINTALSGENIVLNNSSMARRDNIYIDDAVSALMRLSDVGEAGSSYNISSNGEMDNFKGADELAEIIANIVNKEYFGNNSSCKVIRKNTSNSKRNPGYILTNKKLKSTGWEIKTSIEDGLRQTISFYIKGEHDENYR